MTDQDGIVEEVKPLLEAQARDFEDITLSRIEASTMDVGKKDDNMRNHHHYVKPEHR